MKKIIKNILKSIITIAILYAALGVCLVLSPIQMLNAICKIVFGITLVGAGLFHIGVFVLRKENTTILDLFSGVIVISTGAFLMTNPQIIIKVLPFLLAGFIWADSIWTLKETISLFKKKKAVWKYYLIGSITFIVLGGVIIYNPFTMTTSVISFAGWVLIADAIEDTILYILLKVSQRKEKEQKTEEEALGDNFEVKDNVIQKENDDHEEIKEWEES